MANQHTPLRARFDAAYTPEPNSGCWLWVGAASQSNARDRSLRPAIMVDGRTRRAYRVAYELFIGPIPAGMGICHKCDTPLCVNPDHLFAGAQAQNVADMVAKGRERPWNRGVTHCSQGHGYTAANTYTHQGRRYCRTCVRVRSRDLKRRKRLAIGSRPFEQRQLERG